MAVLGIQAAAKEDLVPNVKVDNMPAVLALNRRLSTNKRANELLRRVSDTPYKVTWVSTEEQLADPLTRMKYIPRMATMADVQSLHRRFLGKKPPIADGTQSVQRRRRRVKVPPQ